jgi:cell division protein FtsW
MNKKFLFWDNPKQAVWYTMVPLLLIGCANIFSASFIRAEADGSSTFYYLIRYIVYSAIGLGAIFIARTINYRRLLSKNAVSFTYISVLVMLVLVDFIGLESGGARRWLGFGGVTIQPSEFAKLAIIMLCTRYLGMHLKKGQNASFLKGNGRMCLGATAVYAFLVQQQPDMGTAAIIVALMFCMYVIAGLPWKQIGSVCILGAASAVLLVMTSTYRADRIRVWLDPWIDEVGDGYQMVQSLLSIGSGGLIGTKWGEGSSKFFYLPEAHTDFAFAVFCQENGFLGAFFLILLFAILGCALLRIAVCSKDERGFLLAAGVSFLIVGQAAANMAMVCGLLPVIGVPLVFISYGGSSLIISMAAIGLALSVYDDEVEREKAAALTEPEERRSDLRVVSRRWHH